MSVASGDGESVPGYYGEPQRWLGQRLDWCYLRGEDCGGPAAHAFCELEEGDGWVAQSFSFDSNIGSVDAPTLSLGEYEAAQAICSTPGCDGFSCIQCEDSRTTTERPTFKGYRLDYCRFWGSSCGQPAADAWCRNTHGGGWYADSFDSEWDVGATEPTRVIANSRICDDPGCDSFERITCAFAPPAHTVLDDVDSDGVPDDQDNCLAHANPLQRNRDGDLLGDECDPEPDQLGVCTDGIDNDGDGLLDADDPGCSDVLDDSERAAKLPCDDGVDDDGDGWIDLGDSSCTSVEDPYEVAVCANGVDDDGDGLSDLADPDCADTADDAEWQLSAGDVLVANWQARIVRIDPQSGTQLVLHDGKPLQNPMGVAVAPNGDILISDHGADAVFRLSAQSGDLSVVTSGGALTAPRYMAMTPEGNALVCNQGGTVVRVDLDGGYQTILNAASAIGWCEGVAASPSGAVVAVDRSGDRLVRVAPDPEPVDIAPGGAIDVAFESEGAVVVTDEGSDELYRVDLQTGARTTLSLGQYLSRPRGVAVETDGGILVMDLDGGLLRVEPHESPATNQSVVSAAGGELSSPLGIVTYVPEPGATAMLLAGLCLVLTLESRQRSGHHE